MSFIKRLGNVGRGWVSTQVKGLRDDEDAEREAALDEARRTLAGGERRVADARAAEIAEEARGLGARAREAAQAEEAPEPELDELGLPQARDRTL